jgi:chitinase
MKKYIFGLFIGFIILINPVMAQGHTATLTITPASDAVSGTTGYNIYRTPNACPVTGIGSLTWTKLTTTPITATTYTDSTLTPGTWCYYVTANLGGVESVPSITAGGTAKPNTVTFSITII